MVIGSHWLTRFDQSSSQADLEPDAGNVARQTERRRSVEELSLIFLVTYFTALLSVSAVEVEEVLQTRQNVEDSALASDDEAEADTEMDGTLLLAQRITAVLRRILPALRIASRWLKSHLDYVARASDSRNEELSNILTNFWTEYKRFMLALASLFPLAQLPSLIEALEEDVDMAGFLPLRRGTSADQTSFEDIKADNPSKHEVHPNEEQLMRISDLLVDVKLLMQTEVDMLLSASLICSMEPGRLAKASPFRRLHLSPGQTWMRPRRSLSVLRLRTIQSILQCGQLLPRGAVSATCEMTMMKMRR